MCCNFQEVAGERWVESTRAPSHAATWNSCRPLFQFGTVALNPAPDCRVVRFQDALVEQLFDITQRERVPKGPAYGAKNQLGLRLPPLEDRRPKLQHNPLKAVFEILSTDWKIATCSIERGFFPVFTLAALAFCETPLILLASYELVLLLSRGIRGRQGDQRSFLMKFNEYPRWWVLVLVLGFLASGRYWLDQQDQRVKDQISGLQQENEMLVRRNEQLSYINGLAVEFSMDPTIVTLVDRYSREYMRKSGPEWEAGEDPGVHELHHAVLDLCGIQGEHPRRGRWGQGPRAHPNMGFHCPGLWRGDVRGVAFAGDEPILRL